jgi:hypothetical protein
MSKQHSNKEHYYCQHCGKELLGKERKRKKYCNNSCAASATRVGKKHSDETRIKISRTLQSQNTNFDGTYKSLVKQKYFCLNCGKEIENVGSNKENKFCSNKCQGEFKHKKRYQLILDGDESIMRANYSPKPFKVDILKEQGNVCAICGGKAEHNGKPLVFVLDHIDGNAANNRRENLRCICPNCDSQLETYKSKNKNGARSYYRYHKFDKETKIGK